MNPHTLKSSIIIALFVIAITCFDNTAVAQTYIMLRHAERVAYDTTDNNLSEAGKQRAQALANTLKDAGITAIYTSTRKRSKQTADPLATLLNLKYTEVAGSGSIYVTRMLDHFKKYNKNDVVLVIGHIDTFIPLLHAMGHKGEIKLGDYEHDDLFVAFTKEGESPTVLRLNY